MLSLILKQRVFSLGFCQLCVSKGSTDFGTFIVLAIVLDND